MIARAWDRAVDAACRWLVRALPSRSRTIPHSTDPARPLLTQVLVWPLRRKGPEYAGLSVYLQHFETPEVLERFHDHKWQRMRSFVLSDGYVEQRIVQEVTGRRGQRQARCAFIYHGRGTTYTMTRAVRHRTASWGARCWTLFACWGASDSPPWGYWERRADGSLGPKIPWREGIAQRVASLETGRVRP